MVFAVPVVVLLVMLCVQAAVWYHAANIAQSAAARGAAAGAPRDAGAGSARAEAAQVVADNGATLVAPPVVAVGADEVSVTVTAT